MKLKKSQLFFTVLLTFLCTFSTVFASEGSIEPRKFSHKQNPNITIKSLSKTQTPKIKDRQILIKFKDKNIKDLKSLGVTSVNTPSSLSKRGIMVARIPASVDFDKKIKELNNEENIEYAQPNHLYKLSDVPNDPGYSSQWYLSKIGLPATWNTYKGSSGVTVAVIDSGLDKTHPDLQGRFLQGYDCLNNDNNPEDDNGHGTMVSGVIAANTNNGIGVSGIDWNCKILPIKAGGADGYLSEDAIIDGIYYAMNNGADIINMSFGGYYDFSDDDDISAYQALYNALYEAYSNNIVLVAAAGNESSPFLTSYPAAYPFVISTGATDESDNRCAFSNYGAGLDITAPGKHMYTTSPSNQYANVDGTSFSSPTVAGIVALLLSKNPNLTPAEVAWMLESSTDKPSSMSGSEWSQELGYGRINAYSALNKSTPVYSNETPDLWSDAKAININQTYTDKFELPMDEDWFKFDINTYSNASTIRINVPSSIDAYAAIYKYNSSNQSLTFVKSIDYGYTGDNEIGTFTGNTGTYYLRLYDYNGHWSDSPYSISISTKTLTSLRANVSSATITAGSDYPVTLTATYSDGSVEENISSLVTSTSTYPSIATASGSTISGLSPGSTAIKFSFGGKYVNVRVTVKPQLSSISTSKSSVSIEKGRNESITVTALYADSTSENATRLASWSSANEAVATVSRGRIVGVSAGDTTVSVTYGGQTQTIAVTITPILSSLTADNLRLNLQVGDSVTPIITANYDNNTSSNVTGQCTWSSSRSSSASVSASGTITAVLRGTATIRAKFGRKNVNITVTVTPVLESISFSENTTTVYLGRTKRLKVYAKYVGEDRNYDITRYVTSWGSSNQAVATVSNATVTPVSVGESDITAQYLGQTATAAITVQKQLSSIIATVANRTLTVGQDQPITITARFRVGDPEDVTNVCSWVSSNPLVATVETVDGNTVIRALSSGRTTITASWGGRSSRVYITVTNPS